MSCLASKCSMVTWRPRQRESPPGLTTPDRRSGGDCPSGSIQGELPGGGRCIGIHIQASPHLARFLQFIDILRSMNSLEDFSRHRFGLENWIDLPPAGLIESLPQALNSFRTFRMPVLIVSLVPFWVEENQVSCHRLH